MDTLLRAIQMDMLDMLILFDSICKEYNIQYSLHGGTLLGAVRHKGFIPWDDDLDVFMTRGNYNSFIRAWGKEKHEGYFLQTKEIEEDYTRGFAKIRKEHTLFLQDDENPETIHTGVFIDIFPVDRIPNKGLSYYIFFWNCMKYQLYTREFIPRKASKITKFISTFLLGMTTHDSRLKKRKSLENRITKYNNITTLQYAVLESPWHINHPFPVFLFDDYTDVEFEGRNFMAIKEWDKLLTIWYGDYMTMPPEKDRIWQHHPKAVDLQHNYEEYSKAKGINK